MGLDNYLIPVEEFIQQSSMLVRQAEVEARQSRTKAQARTTKAYAQHDLEQLYYSNRDAIEANLLLALYANAKEELDYAIRRGLLTGATDGESLGY